MEYKGTTLQFVKNIHEDEKIANMLLFGEIGDQRREDMLNGDDFGREMVFLSEIGFKTIRISTNSIGGGIIKGMSIINSMNVARMNGASIETNVVGVADSMAGMISAFGDRGKRTVANFGSGLVHGPMVKTKEGELIPIEELPEGELKTEALNMQESLMLLMISSTGKNRSNVKKKMKEAKRLNAEEMKDFGMVDKVVKISNENIDLKNKSAVELMAACSKIEVENKSKTMKLVNQKLSLGEDAAEQSAVSAIETLQNKAKEDKQAISDKDAEIVQLKADKKKLVDAAQAKSDEAAESYVDSMITAGKLNKENRDALVDQAKANFDGFKTIMESAGVKFVDVTKDLNPKNEGGSKDISEKLAVEFHNLRSSDPDALKNLEKDNPTKYKKLEDAYMNSKTDFDSL